MTFSTVGKTRFSAHAGLLIVNITVLALAARVNNFQDFFFMADLFPFVLSIVTLVLLTFSFLLELGLENSFTAYAPFEIGIFGVLSVLWLAFNAFSTSRWRHIPLACNSIPREFPDEITWCKDTQALKSFVWIEWVICLLTAIFTLRYSVTQSSRGNKHIWKTPLTHYSPNMRFEDNSGRDSEFLQFEKMI
jgi:hypothetical protein